MGLLVFHGKAKALREHLSLQGQEASNAPAKKLPGTVEGEGVWGTGQRSAGATHRERPQPCGGGPLAGPRGDIQRLNS